MIIRELQKIENKQLKKAIAAMDNKFAYCYIDPRGGCDVSFEGEISEKKIQKFFSFLGTNESVQYCSDYEYRDGNTSIFTKDDWKY